MATVQNRGIGVSRAVPEVEEGLPACRYLTDAGPSGETNVVILRDASTLAPIMYQDRRLPTPAPGGDRLFFVANELGSTRAGVWIATARAPVLLLSISPQPDDVVLAVARSVQARAG